MPGSGQAIAGQLLEGTAVRLSPTAAAGTTVPGAGELARVVEDVRAEQPPYAVGRERVRTRIARRLQE